jgi:two-component system, NtrC family, sensor histidine kinase GlrK
MFSRFIALKPRSLMQLTITGFLAVAGLLIMALVISARYIDALGSSSERVLSLSAEAMGAVRPLIEQATAMERNARQFQATGDTSYLAVYQERQRSFSVAADQLSALALDSAFAAAVDTLRAREQQSYRRLQQAGSAAVQADYQTLREQAAALSEQLNLWTREQLAGIQRDTQRTQRLLRWQAGALTLLALGLAALFTRLITRPLRQLEKAIDRLGSGGYDRSIAVEGPADLQRLGTSLDWLRSRLQKLEQQRSAFFRHVSHELKTPLASIQESVALLRDGVAGPVSGEQLKLLAINSNNCQRLQGLIDELLRYHKEIQSLTSVVPKPVRVDRVVEQVLASHDFALEQAGLAVEADLQKLAVLGDAEQLRVIVDNLVTNAIKFSPERGRLFLRWRADGERAVLEVEDQGPGIPEQERELIFQAFYQGAAPLRRFLKSSGLGLAIVQEYVGANRGVIDVLPCATGAHFRASFPLPFEQ